MITYFNSQQLAERCGVDPTVVRRRYFAGEISPDAKDSKGSPLFDSARVKELRAILVPNAAAETQEGKTRPELSNNSMPTEVADLSALIEAGRFVEAFALLPASERADFGSAKVYDAFMRAQSRGAAKVYGPDRGSSFRG